MPDQPVVETRRPAPDVLRTVALTLGTTVALLFLWQVRTLALTLFLAVVAGLALSRATDWLEKHGIKRAIGAPLTMLLLLGALVGLIAVIAPTVRRQARDLTTEVPKAFQKVEEWLGSARDAARDSITGGQGAAAQQQQQQQPQQQPEGSQQQQPQQPQPPQQQPRQQAPTGQPQQPTQQQGQTGGGGGQKQGMVESLLGGEGQAAQTAGRVVFPVLSTTVEAVAGVLIIIFVAIYIAVSPRIYYEGILHLVPHRKRDRATEVLTDLGETLRGWLTARLIAMVVIGLVTGGALALIGVRAAVALGVIAGLMELIPFYGPILAAIPAIGIALVDSPQKAIYVMILYLIVQQFEGNVLTPLLLKQRLEIPPVLTIVAVTSFGIVFGVVGMLAAEPLMAAVLLVVRKLYVRDAIGDEIDEDSDEDSEED